MPVDVWKEVFLRENPEPQHLELFIKMLMAGVRATLEEAARRVRHEAVPDAVVVWRDPIPLVAVASLYVAEEQPRRLKVVAVEPMPERLASVVASIVQEVEAGVYPVRINLGYGRERVGEELQRAVRVLRGMSPRVLDLTDAPGPLGVAAHRAGIRTYTIVRRKGYEVLIEKFSL